MCLQPGEDIGNEVHANVDQFFRIEQGEAEFILGGKEKHHWLDTVLIFRDRSPI
ncbi:MAG: cupin domain-containing protein [Dehalococcoidales bacterium]|nr:cupin domain-containing protein [Dehalococcoidales bacterium]